jgi:hypothetical protein
MFNPWLALTFQAARLTWEAQGVALLMMRLTGGERANQSEAAVMISEKVTAPAEPRVVATPAGLGGSNGARTRKRTLNVQNNRERSNKRKRVRSNKRKLSK